MNTGIAVLHEQSLSLIKYETPDASALELSAKIVELPFPKSTFAFQLAYRGEEDVLILTYDLLTQLTSLFDLSTRSWIELPQATGPMRLISTIDHVSVFLEQDKHVRTILSKLDQPSSQGDHVSLQPLCSFPAHATSVKMVYFKEQVRRE